MKAFLKHIPKLSAIIFVAILATLTFGGHAHADSYNGNDLIDDSLFVNSNTMSQNDIQNFLNAQGGSLASQSFATDSNGTQSSAWIIYYVSQHVGINPQVIMATLQKEESLITDPSASSTAYNSAMGYNCSDSNGCQGYSGFFTQVLNGSWQLRFNYLRAGEAPGTTDSWTSPDGTVWGRGISYPCSSGGNYYNTGLYVGRSVTFIDGGGTPYLTLAMDNRSTAALYCYTPHAYPGDSNYGYSGSYNFVEDFISWWGEVHIPTYQWQYVDQSSNISLTSLPVGQKAVLTVHARNVGTATWYNYGPNVVHLAATNPEGRLSAFSCSSWVNAYSATNSTQSAVAPGQVGTFTFVIQAPNATGSYHEYFNLLAEGITWMNEDQGQYFPITVVTANPTASVQSVTAPAKLITDQTGTVTVKIQNTGNVSWYNESKFPVKLALDNAGGAASPFATSSWPAASRPAILTEGDVEPGQTGTFTFTITAPHAPGTYTDTYNILAEGYTTFSAPVSIPLSVNVQGTYTWSFGSQGAYTNSSKSTPVDTGNMSPGQTAWLVVNAVNTGTATWTNSGSNPVRIGTDNSPDRASRFATGAWIAAWRPATMDQASVAPGQTATFEFPIQVPLGGGTYREYFNPLAEGITWMNDNIGQFFPITVNTGYSWSFGSQGAYTNSGKGTALDLSSLTSGNTGWLVVNAVNTGNATWYNSGNYPMRLATDNPPDRSSRFATGAWIAAWRPATMDQASVAPGQTATFEFPISVPAGAGTYREYFNPLVEGYTRLNNNIGQFFPITVH